MGKEMTDVSEREMTHDADMMCVLTYHKVLVVEPSQFLLMGFRNDLFSAIQDFELEFAVVVEANQLGKGVGVGVLGLDLFAQVDQIFVVNASHVSVAFLFGNRVTGVFNLLLDMEGDGDTVIATAFEALCQDFNGRFAVVLGHQTMAVATAVLVLKLLFFGHGELSW